MTKQKKRRETCTSIPTSLLSIPFPTPFHLNPQPYHNIPHTSQSEIPIPFPCPIPPSFTSHKAFNPIISPTQPTIPIPLLNEAQQSSKKMSEIPIHLDKMKNTTDTKTLDYHTGTLKKQAKQQITKKTFSKIQIRNGRTPTPHFLFNPSTHTKAWNQRQQARYQNVKIKGGEEGEGEE